MGLKADNAQIGQNNTATNNFNLRAPLDGTLRVDRGNDGAVLSTPIKIEANNDITLAGNLLSGVLGAGQTYQNLFASRAQNVTYTNTTGKPIVLSILGNCSNTSSAFIALINGFNVYGSLVPAVNGWGNLYCIVPIGATYKVIPNTGTGTITSWLEMF